MTKDSNELGSGSISSNVLKVTNLLRICGWVSFWGQSVLATISTLILLFALVTRSAGGGAVNNPGTGSGLLFAFLGLGAVYLSIFWSYRYTVMAKKLKLDDRPSRANTLQQLKIGLIISLVGMFLTLIGAEAIVGVLVAKSLSQAQTALITPDSANRIVQPIDIFIVQANTNTMLAHFTGLLCGFWLQDRIAK
jgi:hypothetical protein